MAASLRLHRALMPVGSPLALAIGNFDGVHIGHQAILSETRNAASRLGFQPAALTFNPLPREFFSGKGAAPPRLMSVTEKLAAFAKHGLAHAFVARFGAAFARQSPAEFMQALERANVRWVMVGEDFRFGAKRAAGVDFMRAFGATNGMEIHTMSDIGIDGLRVSSTAIREALGRGELPLAASLLGRDYRIVGRVTHGKKLGRTLGFPTANIALTGRKPALHGVFAVECRLVTRGLEGVAGDVGATFGGVANLGTNPVVSSENRQHLEVFLFDFSTDLYGKRLEVTFIEKIRDELKLPSLDALVMQMHDDAAQARTILSRKNDGYAASPRSAKQEGLQDHA